MIGLQMLGKDLFKVESNVDISYKRRKALILFYNPLIGNDAYYLYEFLSLKGSSNHFDELNKLLNSLRFSIDSFEECLKRLNKYKLLNTLKKKDEDVFIFVLNNPFTIEEFINDDLLVRDFILKTSGQYYQMLISDLKATSKHKGFDDVSYRFDLSELSNWNKDNETFLKPVNKDNYDFGTYFDINVFLEDISLYIFPLKYRTPELLKQIATLADLYNISYDQMRLILSKTVKQGESDFNLDYFKYMCQNCNVNYNYVSDGVYNVPCLSFLMSKQNGKEATPVDKKLLYNLSFDYHLNPEVINALIEYVLDNNNNTLVEKYVYTLASDLHRNDVKTADDCKMRLNAPKKAKKQVNKEEVYDASNNTSLSNEEIEAFNKLRGVK